MNSIWKHEDYRPSAPDSEDIDFVPLPHEQLSFLLERGQKLSLAIESTPYDPGLWYDRGQTLLALGFIELAIADLYKAELLCEHGLGANTLLSNSSGHRYGDAVLNTISERFFGPDIILDADALVPLCEFLDYSRFGALRSLVIALSQARCFQDSIMIADKALILGPDNATAADFRQLKTSCQALLSDWVAECANLDHKALMIASRSGCLYRRVYPWMDEQQLTRSSTVIDALQTEFNAAAGLKTCILRPTASGQNGCTNDYSVFAGRHISQGELLFIDRLAISSLGNTIRGDSLCDYCFSLISSTTTAITVTCCSISFCSKACKHSSLSTYHPLLCRADLSVLDFPSKLSESNILNPTLLLPRLIASYLTSSPTQQHPLSHALLSRRKPDFRRTSPPRFPISFKTHIQQPNQILQALGVDIFADTRFDTWVVQNLLNRIGSNAYLRHPTPGMVPPPVTGEEEQPRPAPPVESPFPVTVHHLGYLLPLFNHSCVPNLVIGEGPGGVWVRARREICEGEELCVSYVAEGAKGLDADERKQLLTVWFNECACLRCVEGRKGP